jgi:hypothetical protein
MKKKQNKIRKRITKGRPKRIRQQRGKKKKKILKI